jgi:ABC-type nickel/cobalt efflux system permease component RcnA
LTGPLNAKGFLVTANGEEVELHAVGFDLAIEGHPLFTFHFEATLPRNGRLTLNDSNYLASEGTSRLALRPSGGVRVTGDDLPTDVTEIPIRPVWQLDKNEEKRTRQLTVDYALTVSQEPISVHQTITVPSPTSKPDDTLSRLLDRDASQTWPMVCLVAFALGAAHAIQPGHGKTLVTASSIGEGSTAGRGALLGLSTATVHMASVALIAVLLWVTRAFRPEQLHLVLAHATGFLIAAIGCWKLGRHLAGHGEHDDANPENHRSRSLWALAFAGGAVPCWDAVALVLVAEAIGRLRLGLLLLAAFSLGMAIVLVAVGAAAGRFREVFRRSDRTRSWERRLGIIGGIILIGIGVSLIQTG